MEWTIRGRSFAAAIAVLVVTMTGACDSGRRTAGHASAAVSPAAPATPAVTKDGERPSPSPEASHAQAGPTEPVVAATGGRGMPNARCVTHADCRSDLVCVFPGDTNCNAAGGGVCRKASACNAGCGAAQCRSSGGKDCRCFSCGGHAECFEGDGCYWCASFSKTSERD